jgi:uncharacterized membrane protein (UPF0127 family)
MSMRLRAVALLLVVGAATGCATTAAPPAPAAPAPSAPPVAPSAPPTPEATSGALDAFVDANGFAALPRGRVLLGAGASGDVLLDVDVVVASTPESQSRGLMGVTDVPAGVGMLFVFPEPAGSSGRPGFWMLDTLVPLDIVFASDGVVVGVATMEPCGERPCPITHPGVDYDVALELAAGALAAAGVVQGDRLVWETAR